jgi:site-specific recombinase XerD
VGTVYRRKVRYCTRCEARLDTTAAWRSCARRRHPIEVREQSVWWIRYRVNGRTLCLSSRSGDRSVAEGLLRAREGTTEDPALSAPVVTAGVTFDDAADDVIADYRMNGKRSLRTLLIRINKHLRPAFGTDALSTVTTARIRAYVLARQAQGASNATINRDLITMKRVCSLAIQTGKLLVKPYVPLLKERNARRGFFEPDEFARITHHLPDDLQGVARFAYITGWRTPSEILPLPWSQVDLAAGEVRLEPGATKNEEARVFPLTHGLRQILEQQRRRANALEARGLKAPYVFCYTTGHKAGQRIAESSYIHRWWQARVAAGCPTRIPHDCRRTAVRNLVRAGVPERVAMTLTGHKTRAIFERYNITSPNDRREAARRLDLFAATGR